MVDVYPDWKFLPNPATLRFPFAVTNQTGSAVYVKSYLTGLGGGSLPAGWTDTEKRYGSLADGSTLYNYHEATRTVPTFSDGVYDESIELRIGFYSDPDYTDIVLLFVEQLNIHHYKSDDPAWTLVDEDTFEIDSEEWKHGGFYTWYRLEDAPRVSGKGYASTYAIASDCSGEYADSLIILVADGNLPEGQSYAYETQMILDTKGLNIADVWLTFGGKHTLAGPNVGLVLLPVRGNSIISLWKKFPKPSANELRVSGLVRYDSATGYWYLDNVRWVKK